MKKWIFMLALILLTGSNSWSADYNVQTSTWLKHFLVCIDSANGTPTVADSAAIQVITGERPDSACYSARITTIPSAWIGRIVYPENAHPVYFFTDSTADCDCDSGVGIYTVLVRLWSAGTPFDNRFSFELTDSSFNNALTRVGQINEDTKNLPTDPADDSDMDGQLANIQTEVDNLDGASMLLATATAHAAYETLYVHKGDFHSEGDTNTNPFDASSDAIIVGSANSLSFDSVDFKPDYWSAVASHADSGAIGASPWTVAGVGSVYVFMDSTGNAITDVNKANFKAAPCVGTGSDTLDIIVFDADSTAVEGVNLCIYNPTKTAKAVPSIETDVNGHCQVNLDPGSYPTWCQRLGVIQAEWDTVTVPSGGGRDTIWVVVQAAGSPPSANVTRLTGYNRDLGYEKKYRIAIQMRPQHANLLDTCEDIFVSTGERVARSDTGYFQIDVIPSKCLLSKDESDIDSVLYDVFIYRKRILEHEYRNIFVPDSTGNVRLKDLLD